jgi:CBS domain containing-hemolysin-like protein
VGVSYGVGVLGLSLLLALHALFSSSEIGFLGTSPARARHLRDSGSPAGAVIVFLQRHRSLALAALLIGITGTVYTAERLAAYLAISACGPRLGPILSVVLLTLLVLVFAEVTPVLWAAARPVRAARFGAFPMAVLALVTLPVTLVMSAFSLVVQWFLRRVAGAPPTYTEDELKVMIDEMADRGEYQASERRILKGILDFGDQTAAQVMVPRPQMVCAEEHQPLGEALDLMLESNHSRLPIYSEDRDNIVGILYAKDLLPYVRSGETDKPCRLVARPPFFVPDTLPADRLLKQLQAGRRLLAIVRDQYGGTAGMVAVEDLVEEIVGPIQDEDDVEEPEVQILGENEWIFSGSVNLHEVANYTVSELPEDEFDSLAGLVMAQAGHIPETRETVTFGRLTMIVERMVGQRVDRVRVVEKSVEELGEAGDR